MRQQYLQTVGLTFTHNNSNIKFCCYCCSLLHKLQYLHSFIGEQQHGSSTWILLHLHIYGFALLEKKLVGIQEVMFQFLLHPCKHQFSMHIIAKWPGLPSISHSILRLPMALHEATFAYSDSNSAVATWQHKNAIDNGKWMV